MFKRKRRKTSEEVIKETFSVNTGKIKSKKKVVDGIKFDSTMEADYYEYLKEQKASGEVIEFTLQPKFELQPKYKKYGKTIRAIYYIGDFDVTYKDGTRKIIDTKGIETADFKLKRKMFDFRYPELTLQLICRDKNKNWVDYDEYKKNKTKSKSKKE